MKKLLNVLLILAVLFTNLVPTTVLAAGRNNNQGTITIENAVENETYSIYKMLNILSYDEEKGIASYEVVEAWKNFFSRYDIEYTTSATNTLLIDSADFDDVDMAEFARAALAYAETNSILATASKNAESETVEFTGLALGYYLVDTSVGTLCSINSTTPNALIEEKNTTTPEDTKSIVENGNLVNTNTAKIGDEVDYQITLKAVANLSKVVAKDTMEESLDFSASSLKIQVEGKDVTTSAYTLTTSAHGFTIEFKDEFLKGMTDDIVITYTAVLNEKAEIAGEGNVNDFKVTYGNNQELETASVTTYSYEMTLEKVTETGSALEGAKFELSQVEDGKLVKLNVVETEDGYRIATAEDTDTTTTIVAGTVKISGLENGTYSLEEIEAPEGFNKLGAPVEFTIEDANIEPESPFQVVNTTGMILPSTGGMGTVLFITVGSIMALGFGVNLVTKARMRKIED